MIDTNQEWIVTPAYDLMYAKGPGGEHSMDISGKGFPLGNKRFVQSSSWLQTKFGLNMVMFY